MLRTLSPGAIQVHPKDLFDAIRLAAEFDFQALDFDVRQIVSVGSGAAKDAFAAANVQPAAFGLPVEWRQSTETWQEGLQALPAQAKAAQELGCTRASTWVLSGSNDRDLAENELFHVERFQPVAKILADHGISLGLEYIGPKTLRDQFKFPFHYTQDGMLGVAKQIGPNVGLLVDAWHWYTSGGTTEDLLRLKKEEVVNVHINDAPEGVPVDEQMDNVRRLPGQTGVIGLAGFVGALREIGYDGPVAVEPFYKELGDLPDDAARLSAVRDSLRAIGL